ncbi:MAG: helix-turn-helix transcriptional regulator [Clostridiales bacterium]|nr:helix-turn-helix transcriptional regulator [Clostridiales bacterium]
MASLGEKLKYIRELRGMGQKEVSELTGISYKTISNYENDRSEPDVEKLALLCQVYNVSADFFISVEDSTIDQSLEIPKKIQKKAPNSEDSESEADDRYSLEEIFMGLYTTLTKIGILKPGKDLTPVQTEILLSFIRMINASIEEEQ